MNKPKCPKFVSFRSDVNFLRLDTFLCEVKDNDPDYASYTNISKAKELIKDKLIYRLLGIFGPEYAICLRLYSACIIPLRGEEYKKKLEAAQEKEQTIIHSIFNILNRYAIEKQKLCEDVQIKNLYYHNRLVYEWNLYEIKQMRHDRMPPAVKYYEDMLSKLSSKYRTPLSKAIYGYCNFKDSTYYTFNRVRSILSGNTIMLPRHKRLFSFLLSEVNRKDMTAINKNNFTSIDIDKRRKLYSLAKPCCSEGALILLHRKLFPQNSDLLRFLAEDITFLTSSINSYYLDYSRECESNETNELDKIIASCIHKNEDDHPFYSQKEEFKRYEGKKNASQLEENKDLYNQKETQVKNIIHHLTIAQRELKKLYRTAPKPDDIDWLVDNIYESSPLIQSKKESLIETLQRFDYAFKLKHPDTGQNIDYDAIYEIL